MKNIFYFCLCAFFTVTFFSPKTNAQIITTIAGNGVAGNSGDSGLATAALLNTPDGIVIFKNNMYIGEVGANCVRKINLTTGIITRFAGTGVYGYSGDNGLAVNAQLASPYGLAVDLAGNIYIADEGNNMVRKVDTTGIITRFAGTGIPGFGGDNGPATAAMLTDVNGVATDRHGNVFIADQSNYCIRKVDTLGVITTIAGTPTVSGYGGDGGPASAAVFMNVPNVYVDTLDNIYVADFYNNRLRKIDASGIINTIAGIGVMGYSGDGAHADSAECFGPLGVYLTSNGNLFFNDCNNNVVRKINTTGIITTVAGTGAAGYGGDNGPAIAALLQRATQVLGDDAGHLYICDYANNCIRKVTFPPSLIYGDDTVCTTATIILNDSLTGGVWSSSNTTVATVGTSTGIVTGLVAGTAIITYTIADSSVTLTITVNPCSATGVKNTGNPASVGLTVFPDPNHGAFTVNISTATTEDATIIITNAVGEKVAQLTTFTNEDTEIHMTMPPGIYFLSAVTKKGNMNKKVVVW